MAASFKITDNVSGGARNQDLVGGNYLYTNDKTLTLSWTGKSGSIYLF